MDELVKAAMAKWPHVPDCYGWLGLDARGRWWMRDDRAQMMGPFSGPGASVASRGSWLQHEQLIAFIHRNYGADERGCWYFQNGPQRVYVELEKAPYIWRLEASDRLRSHNGVEADSERVYVDENGNVYAATAIGCGIVHTQDMHRVAEWVEAGLWNPQEKTLLEIQQREGYVLSPQQLAG